MPPMSGLGLDEADEPSAYHYLPGMRLRAPVPSHQLPGRNEALPGRDAVPMVLNLCQLEP